MALTASQVLELDTVLSGLADAYTINTIARAAGYAPAAATQDHIAQLTTDLTEGAGLPLGAVETGGLRPALSSAYTWLRREAGSLLRASRGSIPLILSVGGVASVYSWMTADQAVAQAKIEADTELAATYAKQLSPAALERIAAQHSSQSAAAGVLGGIGVGTLAIVGGLGVLAYLLLRK